MSAATTQDRCGEPRENTKAALINLLGDEDPVVYQTVRAKILSYGPDAVKWLRRPTLSSDAVLRRRAIEITQYLARQGADNQFLAFCLNQGEELDVEEGSFLLAQTQYPDINIAAYQALFDSYAADLRETIGGETAFEPVIGTINEYLFKNLGFRGNEESYYDPENSYLNRVVDRRTGNPISLCCVYIFLARRLKLPVVGIGMPGHFLCRYQTPTEEIFIDPFNKGKLLTKANCVKYLLQTQDGFKEAHLAPVNPRRTLLRMCSNLHQIYAQHSLTEETSRFQRYIVALAK